MDLIQYLEKQLAKKNVIGYSNNLHRKEIKGVKTDEPAWRIYVIEKQPEEELHERDIIPKEIGEFKTDVIEEGSIFEAPPKIKSGESKKTKEVRPLKMACSIGNKEITAGTLGIPTLDEDCQAFLRSNAHVLTPSATMTPEEVRNTETRILQPGSYDGGTLDNVVGEYYWHKQVHVMNSNSDCPIGNIWAKVYNSIAKVIGADTRLKTTVDVFNHTDFAVMKTNAETGYKYDIIEFPEFDVNEYEFVGDLFGGSKSSTVIGKAKYAKEYGFYSCAIQDYEPKEEDELIKSGRTTCKTKFTVKDASARVNVKYHEGIAPYQDVILASYGCEGGDSGSSTFIKRS